MWPPLQYAIIGAVFAALAPYFPGSHITVPIAVNQFLFVPSVAVLYFATMRIGGRRAAVVACLLAALMTYDVWIGLSAQPEPILVLLTVALGYVLLVSVQRPCKRHLIAMGIIACLLQATHYSGWFASIPAVGYLGYVALATVRRDPKQVAVSASAALGLVLSVGFAASWMVANHLAYGDPLQFLRWTHYTHQVFSWMPVATRWLSVPLATFDAEPILAAAALAVVPFAMRGSRGHLIYLLPAFSTAVFLTAANVLLLGPTRYMPRAMLPIIWSVLPFVGAGLVRVGGAVGWRSVLLPCAVLLAYVSLSTIRSLEYENRVTPELRLTATALSEVFETSGTDAVANILPWADQHALAVLSLHPDRLRFTSGENLAAVLGAERRPVVLSHPRLIALADELGMETAGNTEYIIANRNGGTLEDAGAESFSWQVSSPNTFLVSWDSRILAFGFRNRPSEAGEAAMLSTVLRVTPNACYIVSGNVRDFAPNGGEPWQYLHQVIANGVVLWSYDPTASEFYGWQEVSLYLMPTTSDVTLELRVLALQPVGSADWWDPSQVAFRDLTVEACP